MAPTASEVLAPPVSAESRRRLEEALEPFAADAAAQGAAMRRALQSDPSLLGAAFERFRQERRRSFLFRTALALGGSLSAVEEEAFLRLLEGEDDDHRAEGLMALRGGRSPVVFEHLLGLVREDGSERVRAASAFVLYDMAERLPAPQLARVRAVARQGLHQGGSPQLRTELVDLLSTGPLSPADQGLILETLDGARDPALVSGCLRVIATGNIPNTRARSSLERLEADSSQSAEVREVARSLLQRP